MFKITNWCSTFNADKLFQNKFEQYNLKCLTEIQCIAEDKIANISTSSLTDNEIYNN